MVTVVAFTAWEVKSRRLFPEVPASWAAERGLRVVGGVKLAGWAVGRGFRIIVAVLGGGGGLVGVALRDGSVDVDVDVDVRVGVDADDEATRGGSAAAEVTSP